MVMSGSQWRRVPFVRAFRAYWLFHLLGRPWKSTEKDLHLTVVAILLNGLYLSLVGVLEVKGISVAQYLGEANGIKDALNAWTGAKVVWVAAIALIIDTLALFLGTCLLLFYRWRTVAIARKLGSWMPMLGALAIGGLLITDLVENVTGLLMLWPGASAAGCWVGPVMRGASFVKVWAAWLVAITVGGPPVLWLLYLGPYARERKGDVRQELRVGIGEILRRSRYTVIGLACYAGAMLGLDQTRDVLTYLADSVAVTNGGQVSTIGQRVLGGALIVMSLLSVMMLGYLAWLWPRLLCRFSAPRFELMSRGVPSRNAQKGETAGSGPTWCRDVEKIAMWWPRILGVFPFLIIVRLCSLVAQDAIRAEAQLIVQIQVVMMFVLVTVAGIWVYWRAKPSTEETGVYFNSTGTQMSMGDVIVRPHYQWLGVPYSPVLLPVAALLMASVLRRVTIVCPDNPIPTFPVVTLLFVSWFGLIGFLSACVQRAALPLMVFMLFGLGFIGTWAPMDRHNLWSAVTSSQGSGSDGLQKMWELQFALAVGCSVLFLAIWGLYRYWGRAGDNPPSHRMQIAAVCCLVACWYLSVLGLAWYANQNGPRSMVGRDASAPIEVQDTCWWQKEKGQVPFRCTVDAAFDAWLNQLPDGPRKSDPVSVENAGPIDVYFISSEGGGIRAAFWTAQVLARLSLSIPEFDQRVFSLSGVSGGSVGIAVYRACRQESEQGVDRNLGPGDNKGSVVGCVGRLAKQDLLTPLLSSLMFEDALGQLVPTGFCETPGCGIFNRDAWFEQGLEVAVPELHEPLSVRFGPEGARLPHVFYNALLVETGERVISSDLVVDPLRWHPGARDLIRMMGDSVSVGTAVATSARFPFTNAIGSVYGKSPESCHLDGGNQIKRGNLVLCGHVSDGGSFDNSGAFTTIDLLRALRVVLQQRKGDACKEAEDNLCKYWKELQARLRPHVIQIRTGVDLSKQSSDACPEEMNAAAPRCAKPWLPYVDALGPILARYQTASVNERYGMISQGKDIESYWAEVDPDRQARLYAIDLGVGKERYPLGWGLSPRARRGIIKEVDACVRRDNIEKYLRQRLGREGVNGNAAKVEFMPLCKSAYDDSGNKPQMPGG